MRAAGAEREHVRTREEGVWVGTGGQKCAVVGVVRTRAKPPSSMCCLLAGESTSGLPRGPIQARIIWHNTSGPCGPDGCGRFN